MKIPYVHVSPRHTWIYYWRTREFFSVFRNRPGVIKWIPGKLLPRRWGVRILGLEIGERG